MSANEKEVENEIQLVDQPPSSKGMVPAFDNMAAFENAQRMAKALAASDYVPKAYHNNVPNILVAMDMASRTGAGVLTVMQNLDVIQGKPSWSSKFIAAIINNCGRYDGELQYECVYDDKLGHMSSCLAWAISKETGNRVEGVKITWEMAVAEGWVSKSGSKWKTMPDLMFKYRAASFFGKIHVSDKLLGMQSQEEAFEIIDVTPNKDGDFEKPVKGVQGVKDKLKQNLTDNNESNLTHENMTVQVNGDQVNAETGEIIEQNVQSNPKEKQKGADTVSKNTKTQARQAKLPLNQQQNRHPDEF